MTPEKKERIITTLNVEKASQKDFPFGEGITHKWIDAGGKILANFLCTKDGILVMTFDENEARLDSSTFNLEAGNVNRPQIVIGPEGEAGLRSHKLHLVATQPTFTQTSLDGLSATSFISYIVNNDPGDNISLQIISSK